MALRFAHKSDETRTLVLLGPDDVSEWLDRQPVGTRDWIELHRFSGSVGQALMLPDGSAVLGIGTVRTRARSRFAVAAGMAHLPASDYAVHAWPDELTQDVEALGALLGQYRFDRYAGQKGAGPRLVCPAGANAVRIEAQANGEALTRDLINTPTSDLGPAELEDAVRKLAEIHGANVSSIVGDDLLAQNFPLIHAVGRASASAPRLIDLRWGGAGPSLTLVGKGVCFDTGGLNLKPGTSMGLMKKDMGGAAHVLGLAAMIMATRAEVRLRVLIPAVENSVGGGSFRPQDILTSRKGLTVEINNTDAEGRLVLADALALAGEDPADLLISMATLTGAARVAVGPDIAPFFTDDNALAQALGEAAARVDDPVWRLPFHAPYEPLIEPGIADLDNAPKGGFAGAITAALFLRRFVGETQRFVHFDVYGWQPSDAPARPKGGAGQGIRAVFDAMPHILSR